MNQSDISILIVDDVNTMRAQFKELLKSFGFHTIHVSANVQEAKSAIEDQKFNLILCDWHMAPENGLEFLKYIRQHPNYKTTSFIMVTAESTKEIVLQAIQSGVDDYIVKPLTLAHINKIYKILLKKQVL